MARSHGLPGVWPVVSCETRRPVCTRSGLTGPHHLSWLGAPEMGSRCREDGARTTVLFYLASLHSRSPKRLFNGNANTGRIRIGEDPNRNAASGHRVRL